MNGSTGRKPTSVPVSRRYKPYYHKHRASHAKDLLVPDTDAFLEDPASLKALIKKTWRIYSSTPLYNFSYSKLKTYSQHLTALLKAESKKGHGIDATGQEINEILTCSFSVLEGMKQNPGEPDALQINVRAKAKNSKDEKVLMTAILCSVGVQDAIVDESSSFTCLPLLLIKGPAVKSQHLIEWLQKYFDCCISSKSIQSSHLEWMFALWSGFGSGHGKLPVELCYSFPKEIEGLSRVCFSITPENAKLLWESIIKGEKKSQKEQVLAFISSLEAHVFHLLRINLSALHLTRVSTAIATISRQGQLKLYEAGHCQEVLKYLTNIALDSVYLSTLEDLQ